MSNGVYLIQHKQSKTVMAVVQQSKLVRPGGYLKLWLHSAGISPVSASQYTESYVPVVRQVDELMASSLPTTLLSA